MLQHTVNGRTHWIFRASPAGFAMKRSWVSVTIQRVKYFVVLLAAGLASAATLDLAGNPRDPFTTPAEARVLVFVRTDCPVTNRYAPELKRLWDQFVPSGVRFWLVYPDPSETTGKIQNHVLEYSFPGLPLRDPK